MLPVKKATISYPDGSTYTIPDDGTWAEAPPFGVQCVVYYHVDGLKTVDSGLDVYTYHGEAAGDHFKMGLWLDDEGFHRVMDLALGKVTP